MRRTYVIAAFVAAAGVTAILELLLRDSAGGSIILTIAFWKALSEGAVALAAIAELTRAKWVTPIRRTLLSFYPMILLTSLLMILLVLKFDIYPWTDAQNAWMNKEAFLGRNLLLSLLLFGLAWRVAVVQGGSQALSRSLYSSMSPRSVSGEFFGFFSVMSKFSSILGPVIFAGAVAVFGNSRPAVLSLVVFFVVGIVLLQRVDVEAGRTVAIEADRRLLRDDPEDET